MVIYLPLQNKEPAFHPNYFYLRFFFFFSHHLFHCGFSSTPIFQAANCEQLLGTFPMHQTSIIIIIFFFFSQQFQLSFPKVTHLQKGS